MAEDSLRSAIDAIRSRLHEELETQLANLTARHADEVESARRGAEAEAEQRWSAKVDDVRGEWTARLESEVATVRAEAERRMVAESMRVRVEAEQAAAESAASVREELERALADERARAEQQVSAERSRLEELLAGERSRAEEQLNAERARAEEQLAAERSRVEEQLRARSDEHASERARIEEEVAAARARLEEYAHERTRLEEESAAQRARFEAHAVERARVEEELAAERSRAEEHIAAAQKHGEDLEAERQRVVDLDAQRQRAEDAVVEQRDRLSLERDELVRILDETRHELVGVQAELDGVKQALEAANEERDGAIRDHEAAAQHAIHLTSELSVEREKRDEDVRVRELRDSSLAEARLAERQAQLAIVERVLTALRAMDRAKSLSDVLASLMASAASEAPRVALFVVNGADLRGWKSAGFRGDGAKLQANAKDAGLLGEALRRREAVATAESEGPAAPEFAQLPAGRAALAVPLLVGNQPVAVLYADDAADGTPAAPASWPEAIQILGRHASVTLAHLTAARAADAMRKSIAAPSASHAAAPAQAPHGSDDGTSARRYARLLVSEIKLYNEAAVQVGRQKRDLLTRLKPEIDRARKLYAQRISPAVDSRGALFQQELVQTLADGDPALLGNPA